MKATINNKLLSRNLFFSTVFFITVFFADGFSSLFFMNLKYRTLKLILCVLIPILTTYFNFRMEKSLKFIGKSSAIIMCCFVFFFTLFSLLDIGAFSFNDIASLFHLSYALICLFTVFAVSTFLAEKNEKSDYNEFYNNFFLGYVPVAIMLYGLLYFNYRANDFEYTVNFIPFRGEIKTLFSMFSVHTAMRSIGNFAFYSTIALCVSRFIKKHTALLSFLLPFALCVLSEAAQGIFSIGDADIDDIILNGLGALIGALIYKLFIEKIRRKELCSE